jgi:uncharacterized protein (TIGR03085 family)
VSTQDQQILRAERAALCDTLERYGPDAPTLCAGWTTADLAAHVVVRERDIRATPGILLAGPFGRYTTKLMDRVKARGYAWSIARLRDGPPRFIMATMAAVNVNENWIHHEDVRRANGEGPRPEDPEVAAILLRLVPRFARLKLRSVRPFGVVMELPDGRPVTLRTGDPTAVLRGPVGEAALYLLGRRSAARVELTGDAGALEALRVANLAV